MIWLVALGIPFLAYWLVVVLPVGRPALWGFLAVAALIALIGIPNVIDDQTHFSIAQGLVTIYFVVLAGLVLLAGGFQALRAWAGWSPRLYFLLAGLVFAITWGSYTFLIVTA